METKDPKDQIGNNQLGSTEDTPNTPENSSEMPSASEQEMDKQELTAEAEEEQNVETSTDTNEEELITDAEDKVDKSVESEIVPEAEVNQDETSQVESSTPEEPTTEEATPEKKVAEEPTAQDDTADSTSAATDTNAEATTDESIDATNEAASKAEDSEDEETSSEPASDEPETEEDDNEDESDTEESGQDSSDEKQKHLDYSTLSREELVDKLQEIIESKSVQRVRNDVEVIKVNFYKKHKMEFERKRKEWVDAGNELESFTAPEDPMEPQIKELLKQYRELKADYNRTLEDQKDKNLKAKQEIIETIKELVNRNESVNQTFQEFRELQHKWRDIGPVPQASLNDLWETYHHHVQNFYDYIKINKELRDLDLKRNLEEKIKLCEKAEELLLEQSIINAFKKLQTFHNQWREIGPVPNEHRSEIWERFKEATAKINKKHQEHFESIRDEQKANLEAKIALCEKAEEILSLSISSNKEWNKRSKEMVELQKVWKSIGFAPKKDNNKIYERFRIACDAFFSSKREFYEDAHEEQQNNLQLKTELCMQADSLKDSTEWKKTADELINLQKRWKEIGPVPRKHSEDIWKRFRTACDHFFKQRSEHFSQADNSYSENLKAKEALIEKIENYTQSDNLEENLKNFKDFQRQWAEIGFVPIKKKEEIQKRYREAINKQFENLNVDDSKKKVLRFKTKIDTIQGNPRQENKLRHERERLFNTLKQLENDITLWENNIGFFAKSKNAEQLIKDVERKIAKGKQEIKVLEEKIRLIDDMD